MHSQHTIGDFTRQVIRTDKRPESDALRIAVLGVFGELGSLMSEIKKEVREGPSYISFRDTLVEEAGDLLWYFGALALTLDRKLSELYSVALNHPVTESDAFDAVEMHLPLLPRESGDAWLHAGERVGALAAHVANYGNDGELFGLSAAALRATLVAFNLAQIGLTVAIDHNVTKSLSRFPVSRKPLALYDDRPTPDGSLLRSDCPPSAPMAQI